MATLENISYCFSPCLKNNFQSRGNQELGCADTFSVICVGIFLLLRMKVYSGTAAIVLLGGCSLLMFLSSREVLIQTISLLESSSYSSNNQVATIQRPASIAETVSVKSIDLGNLNEVYYSISTKRAEPTDS